MHHHTKHTHHARPHAAHGHARRFVRDEMGEEQPRGRGHRGHGGRGGGRGGLGRFFAHGDLRLVILNLIAERPRHGYELIKAIEDQAGGAYSPSPGVVYPTLTLLEELGYIAVEATEGAKKLHRITPQGESFLDANRPTLSALLARMAEASRVTRSGEAPQLQRAMENLKLALRLRLAAGPLTQPQIDAIAAALDAAAATVEKVQ